MNKTHISEVKYKRTFNLGNYESETIELTLTIGEEDDEKAPAFIERLKKVALDATTKGGAKTSLAGGVKHAP